MERSSIFAHRGLFLSDADKNSREALKRACDAGFGIETDVRDLGGEIVISHDPPLVEEVQFLFEEFLNLVSEGEHFGRIALNIKSSGLSRKIEAIISKTNTDVGRFFVFDMSVPDGITYLDGGIPVYSRVSDYEQVPSFLERAAGVWVDNLDGTFAQVVEAKHLTEQGIRAALVSPELHQRDYKELWNTILDTRLHESPLFELCTDFAFEAAKYFCVN